METNYFKYIFIGFVIVISIFTMMYFFKEKENEKMKADLDQMSTTTNIQKDIRFAIAEFDTMNPLLTNNRNVQEISKVIFDSIVTLDSHYQLQNSLATEISKQDDLNYLIKLRENVKWCDGTEFSASDVKFTIDKLKSGINSVYTSNVEKISNLEIVDPHTIKLQLSAPVAFFEYNLTFPIISEKYFLGSDISDVNKNLSIIGTGMFKIENIDNNVIHLVKNAEYWNKEKLPMIDKIYVNVFSNMGEVYESFKNGNIDILNLNITNVEDYVGTIGYNKTEYKGRDYSFIALNNANELLANSNVRKAISLAIDKNSIVASVLATGYIPTNYILDYGNWLYNEVEKETYNVDKAKALLEQNGWQLKNRVWQKVENGQVKKLAFTLTVNGQDERKSRFAEEVKNQLANFGISVNVKKVNDAGYVDAINNKNYEMMLATIQASYSPSLTTLFGENNLANYNNEELKKLLYEAENTADINKIKENYGKINEIYDNEIPYISLYRNTKFILSNSGLVGALNPNTYNLFSNIEKWYRQ